jgi:hypothetical protein
MIFHQVEHPFVAAQQQRSRVGCLRDQQGIRVQDVAPRTQRTLFARRTLRHVAGS